MPWGVFVVIAGVAVLLRYVVLPALGIKGGAAITLLGANTINDQTDKLPDVHGPTYFYVNVPAGMLVESITLDGASIDVSGAQQAAGAPPNLRINVTKPSGTIVIVTDAPTGLGRLELQHIGPQNAAQLEAQGLLRRRKNTIIFGKP